MIIFNDFLVGKETQAVPVSDESSYQEIDRRASLASDLQTSPSLHSASYQPKLINAHSGALLTQCTEDLVTYRNSSSQGTVSPHDIDGTTLHHRPVERCDARYFSLNCSSLYSKEHEEIDVNGPYCEGLSVEIDDYSNYSTNDPEEGSYCEQTIVPIVFHIPERPQPIMLEVSPVVIQDEVITTSVPTSTSHSTHGKCSICVATIAGYQYYC